MLMNEFERRCIMDAVELLQAALGGEQQMEIGRDAWER